MKRGVKLALSCFLAASMLLSGCAAQTERPSEAEDAVSEEVQSEETSDTFQIGVSLYSMENEYTRRFVTFASAYADANGLELTFYDGEYHSETQISQVEDMIQKEMDGILLIPENAVECAECADLAAEAGIPLIAVNTRLESDQITCYVGSEDELAGEMIMRTVAERLNKSGNVVILEGPIGQSAQIQRLEGMKRVLTEYPNIHVIGDKTARWSYLEAKTVMTTWIETFDQIDAVVAENDDMALGAAEALEAAGLNIPVVGVNGSEDALQAVKDGRMLMTVFQDARQQAETALSVMVKKLRGEQIETEYSIPLHAVTLENVDEYLQS